MREIKFEAKAILQALDDATDDSYIFPMLDNANFYYGSSRLTVFRGRVEWLVTFSEVLFHIAGQSFITDVCAIGNEMPPEGFSWDVGIMKPSRRSPWTLEDGNFGIDPMNFSLLVRGSERSFRPTSDAYKKIGIGPRSKMPKEAKVLRYLVHKLGDELHATVAESLKAVNRNASKLKVLVQTDEYHHPRLMEEIPSNTESFISLAKAIAANDASLFVPGKSNTHWKYWTEFET